MPGSSLTPLLLFCLLFTSFSLATTQTQTQTCGNYKFTSNRDFSSCNDLPVLNSFLHWNYDTFTRTVNLAYRHTNIDSGKWVAWAVNPTGRGMVGAQSLVAFQNSNGVMQAYTSPISGYRTQLQQGNLSFAVGEIKAEFSNNEIIIFATLTLPGNTSTVNQVWQDGPVNGNIPGIHQMDADNMKSTGTVDFESGQLKTSGEVTDPRRKSKIIHGVLNAVSWGILMPLGAIIARYLRVVKPADPTWFYLHVACQSSAYAIGVAGWGTGLKLGSNSSGVRYNPHRNIGIALFVLGTLQVFALALRPKPDHKYRIYWNIYHRVTGCVVIILSVVNVFKGIDILQPDKMWKQAYIGVIVALGVIAFILELLTWMVITKRKKDAEKLQNITTVVNDGVKTVNDGVKTEQV